MITLSKTRVALMAIERLKNIQVLVIVPTDALLEQWKLALEDAGLSERCRVMVVNTAIRDTRHTDFLVLDECHKYSSDIFSRIFSKVKYRYILGLTATFERLDGKEEIARRYCPVCDRVPVEECRENGWISEFTEYLVLTDVDDIQEYKEMNKEFIKYFEFFDFDFNTAMSCLGKTGWIFRNKLADKMQPDASPEVRKGILGNILYHATGFNRIVQKRKGFINNHPKKLELARRIIDTYPERKTILFANSVKMAEAVKRGKVYSGKDTKKAGRITMKEFNDSPTGCLCTIRKCDEGIDVKGLSLGIVIGLDSSKIRSIQRLGRVIRAEEGKKADIFNIVLRGTVEETWFAKSHSGREYVTIDENGLDDVLEGREPGECRYKIKERVFRY